jgi:hypothetical protein
LRFFIIKTREARTSTSVAIETTESREIPSEIDPALAVTAVGQILGCDGEGGKGGIELLGGVIVVGAGGSAGRGGGASVARARNTEAGMEALISAELDEYGMTLAILSDGDQETSVIISTRPTRQRTSAPAEILLDDSICFIDYTTKCTSFSRKIKRRLLWISIIFG